MASYGDQSLRNWILALIRYNVCNLIRVPKQVLIPILLIWHLVWYCWYDTRSKAMLWYLIFLFWYLFDISALAPVRFFFCWFLFSKTKKKWTKQQYLLVCSKKVTENLSFNKRKVNQRKKKEPAKVSKRLHSSLSDIKSQNNLLKLSCNKIALVRKVASTAKLQN